MAALLLIPLLVSGFLLCNLAPPLYYRLHRFEGQYLYLKTAQWGLVLVLLGMAVSAIIAEVFDQLRCVSPPEWIGGWLLNGVHQPQPQRLMNAEQATYAGWLAFITVVTIAIAYLLGQVWRWVYKSEGSRLALLKRILSDSPLDSRLFEAFIDKRTVLITLESRKAYVATVSMLGEPNETQAPAQEISLIPLLSGYRDKDTLSLRLQNDYHDATGARPDDMSIIVRQADIASISWFDLDTYRHISNNLERPVPAATEARRRVKKRPVPSP